MFMSNDTASQHIAFYNGSTVHCKIKMQIMKLSNKKSSHNLWKFPQIYAVSMGVVLVIMRMHSFQ